MAYIRFGVRFMALCVHCVYGLSGVDRKGKLFISLFVRCVSVSVDKKVKLLPFSMLCLSRIVCILHIPTHS